MVILCTITMPDGRTIRAATEPIVVSAAVGGPWLYDLLLSGIDDFDIEIDIYSLDATASMSQAVVEIITDDDMAELSANWHHPLASIVEIAGIEAGQTWESRTVYLRGSMQALEIGRAGEPTSFAVEAAPVVTSAVLGDDSDNINVDFPPPLLDSAAASMTDVDAMYPIILGTAMRVAAHKVGAVGGVNRLVLCGPPLPDTGALQTYIDGTAGGSYSPVNGSAYTYMSNAAFTAVSGAFTVDYSRGGVARHNDATKATKSAADVLGWLLANSGLDIDWTMMRSTLARLASWPYGIAITQQSNYIDVARDLAKFLPIIEVPGANGLWFAYADPDGIPIEGRIVVGAELVGGIDRLVMSDADSILNSFTLNYLRDAATNNYLGTVTLDASNSAVCALSQQLYGVRAAEVSEATGIVDATTALRALVVRASRVALPHRSRKYILADGADHVLPGSSFLLDDPEYSVSNQVVYVRGRSILPPYVVTLDFMDRTPTSAR